MGTHFGRKANVFCSHALIAYLHYEAPVEEQNFATLLEMLNTMQVLEDDEEYQNPVDLLFEELAKKEAQFLCRAAVQTLQAGCRQDRKIHPHFLWCQISPLRHPRVA